MVECNLIECIGRVGENGSVLSWAHLPVSTILKLPYATAQAEHRPRGHADPAMHTRACRGSGMVVGCSQRAKCEIKCEHRTPNTGVSYWAASVATQEDLREPEPGTGAFLRC